MAGGITHGSDTARLREVGGQLIASSRSLEELATQGRGLLATLLDNWSGQDLEAFAHGAWPPADRCLTQAAALVAAMGKTAVAQADEQDGVSEGAVRSGGGSGGTSPGLFEEGQSRAAADYGELQDGMTDKWESYTTEEREAIFREIVRREAEKYGIEPTPSIIWVDDPNFTSNGVSIDNGDGTYSIKINAGNMDDPMMLHTIYHEMRHAGQSEMRHNQPSAIERAIDAATGQDSYPDGVTHEQVQEWEENSLPGNYVDPKEDFDGYFDQPVERDARAEGSEGVEGLSPDEADELLETGQRTDEANKRIKEVLDDIFG
jgi:hypothetical protein